MAAKPTTPVISRQHRVLRHGARVCRRIRHTPLMQKVCGNRNWVIVLFLVIIPVVVVAGLVIKRTHTNYYFVTGPQGATYSALGPQVAAALNKPDRIEEFLHLNIVPDFIPEPSCGPFDNIYSINHGLANLGFAEDGLPLYFEPTAGCVPTPVTSDHGRPKALSPEIRFRALMPLYLSPLHVVARRKAAYSDVREIPPHTTAYVGQPGSASAFIAQSILSHYGISIDAVAGRLDAQQAVQQLLDGKIEVGFFLDRLHEEKLRSLLDRGEVKLLTIEHAQGLKLLYPYLEVVTIPAATYRSSSKDILTVGTKTLLVTSTELSEVEVYEVAQKLSQHINLIIKDIPFNATRVTDSDPQKDLSYPLHDGAVRFYTHDPPFFFDTRKLAAVVTYFSVLYAGYGLTAKRLREYRVHRLLHAVDRAIQAFSYNRRHPRPHRFAYHSRKLRSLALSLLRRDRIHLNDFKHIDEYIKGHI